MKASAEHKAMKKRHSDSAEEFVTDRSRLEVAPRSKMPELGSDRNRVYGRYCLNAFLLFGWVLSISQVVEHMVGERARKMVNQFGGAGYCLLLLAAVFFYERKRRCAVRLWTGYVRLFLVCIVLLVISGVMIGNAPRVMGFDMMALGTVFGVFVLGRRDEVWEDVRPIVMVLSGVSIGSAIVFMDGHVLVDRGILNDEIGSHFETGLVLAPLFCITAFFDRKVWRYYVFMALSAGCFFVYIYFGRRGVSTRCAAELLIATILLPLLVGRFRRAFVGSMLVVGVAIALVSYFPFYTIVDRFLGSSGLLSTVTTENGRWEEGRIMFDEFVPAELLMGRGIGGAFAINQSGWLVADKIDETRSGRFVVHAGAFYPFLKGGMLFWFVYFLPIFTLFVGAFRWRQLDPITIGTLGASIVFFGFQFVEGAPTYMAPWVSCGIGMIMSRAQNVVSIVHSRKLMSR